MNDLDRLRTILANERTLLAYIRTALALLIFGMAAIKFFPDTPIIAFLGWIFMAWGLIILIWGVFHFRKVSKLIQK
ncbi:MAG: DUF202 domain-containing protein [Candidatus Omnitrophota bacterium]|nr:DUF202 domain-containing protein [Candidatus Omnitrophota bacterium]